MSSKYKVGEDAIPHFVTFTTVGWIDVFPSGASVPHGINNPRPSGASVPHEIINLSSASVPYEIIN